MAVSFTAIFWKGRDVLMWKLDDFEGSWFPTKGATVMDAVVVKLSRVSIYSSLFIPNSLFDGKNDSMLLSTLLSLLAIKGT